MIRRLRQLWLSFFRPLTEQTSQGLSPNVFAGFVHKVITSFVGVNQQFTEVRADLAQVKKHDQLKSHIVVDHRERIECLEAQVHALTTGYKILVKLLRLQLVSVSFGLLSVLIIQLQPSGSGGYGAAEAPMSVWLTAIGLACTVVGGALAVGVAVAHYNCRSHP